jgi:hypothetical protein
MTIWYAVSFDIALHLGDVLIERAGTLRWDFFRWGPGGRGRDMAYHQAVIMGFSGPEPLLNRDFIDSVPAYGIRCINGEFDTFGLFKKIINYDIAHA